MLKLACCRYTITDWISFKCVYSYAISKRTFLSFYFSFRPAYSYRAQKVVSCHVFFCLSMVPNHLKEHHFGNSGLSFYMFYSHWSFWKEFWLGLRYFPWDAHDLPPLNDFFHLTRYRPLQP